MMTNYDACVSKSLNKNEHGEILCLGDGSSEGVAGTEGLSGNTQLSRSRTGQAPPHNPAGQPAGSHTCHLRVLPCGGDRVCVRVVGCLEDGMSAYPVHPSSGWAVRIKPQAGQAWKTPSSLQALVCLEACLFDFLQMTHLPFLWESFSCQ